MIYQFNKEESALISACLLTARFNAKPKHDEELAESLQTLINKIAEPWRE